MLNDAGFLLIGYDTEEMLQLRKILSKLLITVVKIIRIAVIARMFFIPGSNQNLHYFYKRIHTRQLQ